MKASFILSHLLAIIIITIVIASIYITAQQIYRTGLDDPQIQLTQDIDRKLKQGVPVNSIISHLLVFPFNL